MSPTEIQIQRIKQLFITAAKDMIRGEGLAVISARNVAERAGYSYATLYNYFSDIRDLIFSCIEEFMEECRIFIKNNTAGNTKGIERISLLTKSYVKFFIQYPGIFELIYMQKPADISSPNSAITCIDGFFKSIILDDPENIKKCMKGSLDEISIKTDFYSYAVHGLLLFHLNRRNTKKYSDIMKEIENLTSFL